jgi:hypothetical protein
LTAPYPLAHVDVDALFLANNAEVPPNGLLYVLGAAWTRCWPLGDHDYPYERPIVVVAIFRVPWNETNVQHAFKVAVQDDDNKTLAAAEGMFTAGRQPDLTDGASQVVAASLPLAVKFERFGLHSVVAEIDGVERKRIQFEALPNPATMHGGMARR